MATHPPDEQLDVVQRWFRAVVTHPGGVEAGAAGDDAQRFVRLGRDELQRMVRQTPTLSAHERLSIYANAYYARLLECMAESFPVFQKAVGEELFNDFAFTYLQEHPPSSYSLNHLADRFPDFLARSAAEMEGGAWADFLVDLARFEWTIADVFDGPGTEAMTLPGADALRALTPAAWRTARLELAPCLRLLALRSPINDYYAQVRFDQTVPSPPDPTPTWTAISRADYVVRRHPLEEGEYLLLEALASDQTVESAIAACASHVALDDAALAAAIQRWFQRWAGAGFFTAIHTGA